MTFPNPLDALIQKIPFSFFCRFLGLGHLRGSGLSLGRTSGGPSIEPVLGGVSPEGCIEHPPPPLRAITSPCAVSRGRGAAIRRFQRGVVFFLLAYEGASLHGTLFATCQFAILRIVHVRTYHTDVGCGPEDAWVM